MHSDVTVSLEAAEFSAGHLEAGNISFDLDTHVRVSHVAEIYVVEIETELDLRLRHAEITGTGGWRQRITMSMTWW